MKKIAWYTRCFLGSCVACAFTFAAELIWQPSHWKRYVIALFAAGLVVAFLFITLRKKLAYARLIVENQILHIQPAVFCDWDGRKEIEILPSETVEMFVSCFGILLGSKIIKFNQQGIRLKAVEIGRNYLSIDYGTDTDIRNVRQIHDIHDSAVLACIIEKFRFETGVVPVITE